MGEALIYKKEYSYKGKTTEFHRNVVGYELQMIIQQCWQVTRACIFQFVLVFFLISTFIFSNSKGMDVPQLEKTNTVMSQLLDKRTFWKQAQETIITFSFIKEHSGNKLRKQFLTSRNKLWLPSISRNMTERLVASMRAFWKQVPQTI